LILVGSWGWAFVATAVTLAAMVLSIFSDRHPNVLIATLSTANNLTVGNASSASYALRVMTIIVAIFLPGVLVYQAWTYHVFRRRLARTDPVQNRRKPDVQPTS
jgi:cytochrome d ubiquinol oxidase subunit II